MKKRSKSSLLIPQHSTISILPSETMTTLSDEIQVIRNAPHYLGNPTMEISHYKWERISGPGRTLVKCNYDGVIRKQ